MKKPPGKGHAIGSNLEEPSVHPAIREIRVGRGYGVTLVPVVDFIRFQDTKTLHVFDQFKRGALCGTKSGKQAFQHAPLEACDPKALMVDGKPVCGRCQKLLGHVPMPRLVIDQGDQ